MMKLSTLRARHARERRALVREALTEAGWTYRGAAELLGCCTSAVQKIVERDAVLREEREEKALRAGVGGRPAA